LVLDVDWPFLTAGFGVAVFILDSNMEGKAFCGNFERLMNGFVVCEDLECYIISLQLWFELPAGKLAQKAPGRNGVV